MTETENLIEETPFYKNWTELIQPERLEVDRDSHTESYGKFVCQPLERGFATTIGNSLRRILLSSIQGAAITSVRIDKALHEFTAITGVLEDVTEIILNLKVVRLKLNTAEGQTVRIDKKGKGPVTAADIISDGSVEIMNPDQHICTITGKGKFTVELEVKWGKYREAGYRILINVSESTGGPPLPNNPPLANADAATTPQDTPITIDVLSNDTDEIVSVVEIQYGNVCEESDIIRLPFPISKEIT